MERRIHRNHISLRLLGHVQAIRIDFLDTSSSFSFTFDRMAKREVRKMRFASQNQGLEMHYSRTYLDSLPDEILPSTFRIINTLGHRDIKRSTKLGMVLTYFEDPLFEDTWIILVTKGRLNVLNFLNRMCTDKPTVYVNPSSREMTYTHSLHFRGKPQAFYVWGKSIVNRIRIEINEENLCDFENVDLTFMNDIIERNGELNIAVIVPSTRSVSQDADDNDDEDQSNPECYYVCIESFTSRLKRFYVLKEEEFLLGIEE